MSNPATKTLKLSALDNVVVALSKTPAGSLVDGLTVQNDIPSGHKISTRPISAGEPILKYGQIIGYATTDIEPGTHIHTHNLEFRNTSQNYEFSTHLTHLDPVPEEDRRSFMGYRRENGKVGTRNYIGVLTSVNCSATAARFIADAFSEDVMAAYPNVDGVVSFVHGTGCGMADNGEGYDNLQRVLWGYARNPNLAGVLLVGLGCEVNQIDFLLEAYGLKRGPLFQTMNIQNTGGLRKTIDAGSEIVKSMLEVANQATREPCPVSELTVALQCGGSDSWSGVTANPALGYAADLLVRQGGTAVLAETPEIYGAEHLLTRRAVDEKVGKKLIERIEWWQDYTARNFGSMDNNPSPGNKLGGLSTILEKSLGAAAKSGTSPLTGVYKYGEPIDRKGFVFMDSPGYDPCSVTGQIASGCNIVCFTTGRGSAFGAKPSPSIKIATNSSLAERMSEDMDINAGRIATGEVDIETVGKEIFEYIIQTASGRKTLSEAQGLGDLEFVPWQIGATM